MIWLSASEPGKYPDMDGEYLDRLEGVLGREKLRELLSDGLLELADRLEHLRRLAARGRHDQLASIAHDMIGTAGHMGLTRLSLAVTDLEQAARRRDPSVNDGLAAVEAAAEPAFSTLRRRIGVSSPQ